ncbi:MAG: hypothetical protein ACREP2_05075 [Rhodanobacteraceae bacterium]
MNAHTLERQPHAVLDLPSRNWKAMKIERLLECPCGNTSGHLSCANPGQRSK